MDSANQASLAAPAPHGLFKTSIVIWTSDDPSRLELDDLAEAVDYGIAFCTRRDVERIDDVAVDPDWLCGALCKGSARGTTLIWSKHFELDVPAWLARMARAMWAVVTGRVARR